jgi:hypothetical protein
MHTFSFAQFFALSLLVTAPLASAYVDVEATAGGELTNKRFIVSSSMNTFSTIYINSIQGSHIARVRSILPLEARHHTEAQM